MTELHARIDLRWDGHRSFAHGKALTAAERSRVGRRASDVAAALDQPLAEATVRHFVKLLMANMKQGAESYSAPHFVAGLAIALRGRCEAAFVEAMSQIIAGEAPGFSPTYLPATPEIARFVRRTEDLMRLQHAALIEAMTLEEGPAPKPEHGFSAETLAKMQERVERLTRAAAMTMGKAFGRPGTPPTGGEEAR